MEALHRIDEGIWTLDLPHSMMGVQVGTRSTLVRLSSGGLLLLSPGPFEDVHFRAIEAQGEVEALVAPNTFHHLFLSRAAKRFPSAKVFLAPGLREKVPNLPAGEVLSDDPLWSDTLDQRVVQGTITNEVAFLHRSTRTLILTDLAFNILTGGLWTRIGMMLNGGFGRFGPTRVLRSTIKDQAAFATSVEAIARWDFDRIVVGHGELLELGGKKAFNEAFGIRGEPASTPLDPPASAGSSA